MNKLINNYKLLGALAIVVPVLCFFITPPGINLLVIALGLIISIILITKKEARTLGVIAFMVNVLTIVAGFIVGPSSF